MTKTKENVWGRKIFGERKYLVSGGEEERRGERKGGKSIVEEKCHDGRTHRLTKL